MNSSNETHLAHSSSVPVGSHQFAFGCPRRLHSAARSRVYAGLNEPMIENSNGRPSAKSAACSCSVVAITKVMSLSILKHKTCAIVWVGSRVSDKHRRRNANHRPTQLCRFLSVLPIASGKAFIHHIHYTLFRCRYQDHSPCVILNTQHGSGQM